MNDVSIADIIKSVSEANLHPRLPKKLKVKYFFYRYLIAQCGDNVVCQKDESSRGYMDYFQGIPVEIDDEINGIYEFVY